MRTVAAAVAEVRERIAAAEARAGRTPSSVRLVAVTKTVPAERVAEAVAAGVPDLGENRAQELLAKAPALAGSGVDGAGEVRWHFVGALQRNKVRALVPWIALWQSVDRAELGAEVARRAPGARVLVEVNVAEEPQKAGCRPEDAEPLVDGLRALGLHVDGLMAVPPAGGDPRRWFAGLRELGARLGTTDLSMGMSGDFEVAVEEGSTIVRVGQALFGARPPP